MYGLPLQTLESIRKTCASVAALSPSRIACFGYAHLPRLKANQRRIDESQLPSQDQRIDQADLIASELARHGYVKIGIDHFARPGDSLAVAAASGKLHRNFQGYTDDDRQGSAGTWGLLDLDLRERLCPEHRGRSKICPGHRDRLPCVSAGLPVRCIDDRQRAAIIERLMCHFEVDLDAIAPAHDFDEELAMLASIKRDGLVDIRGRKLIVTDAGRSVVRVVAACFDTYRRTTATQFSTEI